MKRTFSLLVFVAIMLALPVVALAQNPDPDTETQPYVDLFDRVQENGRIRVIVGLDIPFQPEGELSSLQAINDQQTSIHLAQQELIDRLADLNVSNIHEYTYIPSVVLDVDEHALSALTSDPAVRSITEDKMEQLYLAESIPLIGADVAWQRGYSGAGWTVAVIDSGVDSSHPFLQGKVVDEACYSTSSYPGVPEGTLSSVCPNGQEEQTGSGSGIHCNLEGCEHGTHVAGTAAGRGTTFSGVARDASIISIQVQTQINSHADCLEIAGTMAPCGIIFNSDTLKALERVYELRNMYNIAAVNMSLGGQAYSSEQECDSEDPVRKAAIDTLRAVGIPTIVASGNSGYINGIGTPACISTAFSVGSTNDGSKAGTTVDQVSAFSNSASFLDLLAPGHVTYSSIPSNSFGNMSGTSMATPHVAGAWAVLKSKAPEATIEEVFAALRDSGKPIEDYRNSITKPRIQVDAALNQFAGELNTPTNLQASLDGKSRIQLTWQDTNREEEGYTIERWSGTEWTEIGSVGADVTTYIDDDNITCEREYFYQVYAFRGTEYSDYSEQASILTGNCAAPGDCNEDELVDAADLSAIALEISQGTFDSVGCDANRDDIVNEADIDCTMRLIFGGTCSRSTSTMRFGLNVTEEPGRFETEDTATTHAAPVSARSRSAITTNYPDRSTDTLSFISYSIPIAQSDDPELPDDEDDTSPMTSTNGITLTGLAIEGPRWGATLTEYSFTAVVTPSNASRPITYTWTPQPKQGQGSEHVRYDWATPGRKTIMVTATNGLTRTTDMSGTTGISGTTDISGTTSLTETIVVSATHTITITPDLYAVAPVSTTIAGPVLGDPLQTYTFTTVITPNNLTRPVTYTWTPAPLSGQGTVTATYNWNTPGPQTVAFTVSNRAGVLSTTHTITLSGQMDEVRINGPTSAMVGDAYEFSATVVPTPTLPITYTWHPEPLSGQDTRNTIYRWDNTGEETLYLTATNGFQTRQTSHTLTLYQQIERVTIKGATLGSVLTDYTFVATVEPAAGTQPYTYTWSPEPLAGQGTKYATYRWTEATRQNITVAVANESGSVQAEHTITLSSLPAGPVLTVPNWRPAIANEQVDIPITFLSDELSLSSVAFSVDYDEDLLLFNPYLAESVQFIVGSQFAGYVDFDIVDRDGELDIVMTDKRAPLATLPNDIFIVSLRFQVRTPPADDTLAEVKISANPSRSFGNTQGMSVGGSQVDGSVVIAAEPRPVIGLPPSIEVDGSTNKVEVPVSLRSQGHTLTALGFQLDYDEGMLGFDATDSNSDGVPDAIKLPDNVQGEVVFDSTNTNGELLVTVHEQSTLTSHTKNVGLAALPDESIASITFDLLNADKEPDKMAVRLVAEQNTSFEETAGTAIDGTINGGAKAGTIITVGDRHVYLPLISR